MATTLTVYGKTAGCPPCAATGRAITHHGLDRLADRIDHHHVDQDEALADQARELAIKLELRQEAPLVLLHRGGKLVDYWTGYRADKLKALAGQLKAEQVPAAEFTEAPA